MAINPALLPDELDANPEPGLVCTIIYVLFYGGLLVWMAVYLLRKLPRRGGLPGEDAIGEESPHHEEGPE